MISVAGGKFSILFQSTIVFMRPRHVVVIQCARTAK